jgi:putative tricarboxylic transport membrane protein
MTGQLDHFLAALASFASFSTLFNVLGATFVGIVIGALPGLTATMGVALFTTLTYTMEANQAILVLICVYVGAIYGGSRSAILLNIPGTPANAATTLDGYPLAQQGRAGYAMGIATTSSAIGTLIGIVFLLLLAPPLAQFALSFQSYEFFWLAIFGIVVAGLMCAADDPLKGWIAGILGLLAAMVGQETIHAHERFSYGITDLSGGFGLIPVLVGVFGLAEVLTVMRDPAAVLATTKIDRVLPRLVDITRYWRTILRSGLIGTGIGIIPGVGEDIGAWVSYAAAKRSSKEPEMFGKGSIEGLTAAETGNNAAIPGAIIPVLTLGIPGSAPAAVLLAAMFIHGVRPGPLIMQEAPEFVYGTVIMLVFATLAMAFLGLVLARPLLYVLRVPRHVMMPIVFVLCVIGPFAISQRLFDIWVMVGFGIAGFVLREMKYPMAPLVLGVILGDILDKNLRRTLTLADGDLTIFLTRPISAVLWVTTLLVVLGAVPQVRAALARLMRRPPRSSSAP